MGILNAARRTALTLIDTSLRAKITAALVLVAASTSALSGFFAINASVSAMRREQQRESLIIAQTIASQTDELLGRTRVALQDLAADPVIATLDAARVRPILNTAATSAELLDGVVVADAKGRIVAMDAVPPETGGLLRPSPGALAPGLPSAAPGFSEVYRSVSGRWCFAVVERVRRRGAVVGEVAGIVALNRHTLGGLKRVRFGKTGHVIIMDGTGRVILHPNSRRFLQDIRGELPALVWSQSSGSMVYTNAEGSRQLAGFAHIPQSGWIVIASRTLSEAYGPSKRLALLLGVIFLACLLLAALLGAALAGGISRPIGRLVQGARELASGNLDERLERTSRDEIGVLIDSFNAMARRLSRMISQLNAFGYSVAHDLRAPARAVAVFSELVLRKNAALDQETRRELALVRDAGERMRGMLDGLLELSRISQVKLAPESADLSTIAGEVAAELAAGEPARAVKAVIAPGLADRADPRLVRILLKNLLDNAWKFTRSAPEPRVEFGRQAREGQPAYFVRDNGAGLDSALAGKLFMPFQRLPNAQGLPGLGLGLAAASHIVEAHGGAIWIESAGRGRGATVFFTLRAG